MVAISGEWKNKTKKKNCRDFCSKTEEKKRKEKTAAWKRNWKCIQNMAKCSYDDDLEDECVERGDSLENVSLFKTEFCETNVADIGDLNAGDCLSRIFRRKKKYYTI